jgi:hypothetical protein
MQLSSQLGSSVVGVPSLAGLKTVKLFYVFRMGVCLGWHFPAGSMLFYLASVVFKRLQATAVSG